MDRIDAHSVAAYLVMQMRSQRQSGVARQGDDVAPPHPLSASHADAAQMRIEGFVPAAVVDDDRLAGGAVAQRHFLDRPVGRSEDARTFGNGVVDALMRAQHLLERIDTHAVGGGEQRQLLVDDRLDGHITPKIQ